MPYTSGIMSICLGIFILCMITILILHARGIRWFYHLGPPLLNEEWQTSASENVVKMELTRFAGGGNLIVYHWRDSLGFRLKNSMVGMLTRATITTKSTEKGAVLNYQVRVSIAFHAALVLMYCAMALLPHWRWTSAVFALSVPFWLYFMYRRHTAAINELARLPELRRQLQPLGIHVCDNCGYDLFQREPTCACPECGVVASLSPITRHAGFQNARVLG